MKPNNIAVFGLQLGDEAKGRCAYYLSKNYEWTARVAGGSNAGHTIYHNGKKIVRHLLPSTDFSIPNNKAFLGAGMVIDPRELFTEILETERMFPHAGERIIVDPDAFVVLEKHIEEDKAKNGHIGSTNKGITPAYKDKIGRVGVKIRHLIRDNAEVIQDLKRLGVQFKHVMELREQMQRSSILYEGSQSIQLDLNFGNYPFVTSGDCGLGGIYNAGFAFAPPTTVYGIAKAGYMTKAGGGDGKFTTELTEEESAYLRSKGNEIGATTGRPRRIGAMDLPALKYSIIKGGITDLILTKLDVLDGMEKIKVCYDYAKSVFSGADFEDAKPYYKDLPGWKNSRDIEQIKPFLKHIEAYLNVPIEYVSVGVNDADMIHRPLARHGVQPAQELVSDRLNDPFENPPPTEPAGFVKYGNPLDTTELDKRFKEVGYPTLADLMTQQVLGKKIS
jgi:adenylosuccinate synthase